MHRHLFSQWDAVDNSAFDIDSDTGKPRWLSDVSLSTMWVSRCECGTAYYLPAMKRPNRKMLKTVQQGFR